MGKERLEAKRHLRLAPAKVPPNVNSHQSRTAAVQIWSNNKCVVNLKDLSEDGRVKVTLRTETEKIVLVCAGQLHEGNSYTELIGSIRDKGLIRWDQRAEDVFIEKELGWELVDDPFTDRYNAGQNILLVVKDNPKTDEGDAFLKLITTVGLGVKKAIKKSPVNVQ